MCYLDLQVQREVGEDNARRFIEGTLSTQTGKKGTLISNNFDENILKEAGVI